ncbi:MAG: zf-HC2 domain-containing protein [Desulfurivibrionaceae bacterium]
MQCTEVLPLFTELTDNTLSREELHALNDHLQGCPACALEWREFQQTLSLVSSLETQAPPADLLPGIQAKLAKQGIFARAWRLVEALNFSLSIPAAAAIFSVAMLGGFLLKTSPLEQPAIFQALSSRNGAALPQREISPGRPVIANPAMFAVSHNDERQSWIQGSLARTALATNSAPDNNPRRLLSPDIHVLIEDIDHDSLVTLCREMSRRNWQLHRITSSLFLLHLPQADLEAFHALLAHHRFSFKPASAAEARFGSGKKVLTAAIRFQ